MDITLNRQESNEALIKITLKEADYQPQVSQKIKEYGRKAQLKGFRAGKVPLGLVKKMYGKSILVDEINKLLSSSINGYIKENDLKILGDPLPNLETGKSIDWDLQKDFEFEYNIGLVGDFKYDISKKRKVTEYTIKIDDEMVDEELGNIRRNYGEHQHPDTSAMGDMIKGEVTLEEPAITHSSTIFTDQVDKKEHKKFLDLKVDDKIEFDLKKAFKEPAQRARLLGKSLDELQEISKSKVTFTVEQITRVEPAKLDQELFDKLFGKDQVKSEKELKDKIKGLLSDNYGRETDHFLNQSIREEIVGATKMELPEGFLKKWLIASNEGKVTQEDVDKEFPQYADEMKWNLILNKIADDNELKVENEEVVSKAKDLIRSQLASSGLGDQMEDQLDVFADNYLKGEEGQNYMKVFNQVRGDKIIKYIREHISISKKEVNLEQFRKAVMK